MSKSIQEVIDHKIKEAIDTTRSLRLDQKENQGKKIIELACGLGALSKILKDNGHDVVSCDDLNYDPPNHEFCSINQLLYVEANKVFQWPRHHFFIDFPHHEHVKKNIKMFESLKTYGNNYDLIIIQAFPIWQSKFITLDCTKFFIHNLMEYLDDQGKILLGYVPHEGHKKDSNFEASQSYIWLNQWRTSDYDQCIGYYVWEIPKENSR